MPRPEVHGVEADAQTRCAHYRSPVDIIAVKFKCCGRYYSCIRCHAELAGHATQRWTAAEGEEPAVLCGACGAELTIREYTQCHAVCPRCGAGFNPLCAGHWPLYFELPE
jgi:uncharacterized CHY-type Zn-finger protein